MHCYVGSNWSCVSLVASKANPAPENGLLMGKLVHLALPVRWSLLGENGRGPVELACTYDIHPRGARLLGMHEVNLGELVMVERGRNKALCQVVWAADPASPLAGQFTVQCVEGKTPWHEELRQLEEEYRPLILEGPNEFSAPRSHQNRRRRPRYAVDGKADVIEGVQRHEGHVEQISEFGARITTGDLIRPGTDFRLLLNVFDVSMALKAQVKCLVDNLGMGVEFQQIRRGDRPLLEYVLSRLRKARAKSREEFPRIEVVAEPLAATG